MYISFAVYAIGMPVGYLYNYVLYSASHTRKVCAEWTKS